MYIINCKVNRGIFQRLFSDKADFLHNVNCHMRIAPVEFHQSRLQ